MSRNTDTLAAVVGAAAVVGFAWAAVGLDWPFGWFLSGVLFVLTIINTARACR